MEEKFQKNAGTVFSTIAIEFLIKGLEKIKATSNKNDNAYMGVSKYFRDRSLSEGKRNKATEAELELGRFIPSQDDAYNMQHFIKILATCREQAKNLSQQNKHQDEGSFGKGMDKIELFLRQYYQTLIECSGYCLLKVEQDPTDAYKKIEELTGVQNTIIFCQNTGQFYYKDITKKSIYFIQVPSTVLRPIDLACVNAHKQMTESFQSVPCGTYRKANARECNNIFLMTDKKSAHFLDVTYDKQDAYSVYLYYMAQYLASCIYTGAYSGFIKKFTRLFVPDVDKVPYIIETLGQCQNDLNILDKNVSSYQGARVKIVLGSLEQLQLKNKNISEQAHYEPTINISLAIFSNISLSTKAESSEGRLKKHIEEAETIIKNSHQKLVTGGEKIKLTNKDPVIINNNDNNMPGTFETKKRIIQQGVPVLPEYPYQNLQGSLLKDTSMQQFSLSDKQSPPESVMHASVFKKKSTISSSIQSDKLYQSPSQFPPQQLSVNNNILEEQSVEDDNNIGDDAFVYSGELTVDPEQNDVFSNKNMQQFNFKG